MNGPHRKIVAQVGLTVSPDGSKSLNSWIREANEVVDGVIEPKKQHSKFNGELSQLLLVRQPCALGVDSTVRLIQVQAQRSAIYARCQSSELYPCSFSTSLLLPSSAICGLARSRPAIVHSQLM